MKILLLGDVVGAPGRDGVKKALNRLAQEHALDFVVVNAENAAGGSGITTALADEFFAMGIDVLTSGDHIWKKKETEEFIGKYPALLRPANFPEGVPGFGSCIKSSRNGLSVGVISLVGRVFMANLVDCPFVRVKQEMRKIKEKTNIIIVDFHAEATSEKIAMGWYLDGEVTAVVGTHTHVQTADERILPKGTAYISDLGMCGAMDSVIGRESAQIIQRFLTGMPVRFDLAKNNVQVNGCLIHVDQDTGHSRVIERIKMSI